MHSKSIKYSSITATIIAVLTLFQNCGGFQGAKSRKDFLSQSSVFSSAESRPPTPSEPSVPETPIRPPKDEPLDLTPVTYCSNAITGAYGGNILLTDNLELIFVDGSGNQACVYKDRSWLTTLRDLRILKIQDLAKNCPDLIQGRYQLQIKGPTTRNMLHAIDGSLDTARLITSIGMTSQKPYNVKTIKNEDGLLVAIPDDQVSGVRPLVLYRNNPANIHRPYAEDVDQYGCNLTVSPLLVRVTKGDQKPHPLVLTAPEQGRFFDILGENSFPYAHAEKLISWFTASTVTQDYFLVLPDARGEVRGANELFGNNTRGPDGLFSENGYLALAKYDGRKSGGTIDRSARDGSIDSRDEIFSQLKLWSDDNKDGVAQKHEMISMAEAGLTSIDLNYDSNYLETDRYGNETRFKSVAHSTDGRMHLVFDLWFVIKDFGLNAQQTAQVGQ